MPHPPSHPTSQKKAVRIRFPDLHQTHRQRHRYSFISSQVKFLNSSKSVHPAQPPQKHTKSPSSLPVSFELWEEHHMLHTATKPFIPNPDIRSGHRLYIIHPIPFPLHACTSPPCCPPLSRTSPHPNLLPYPSVPFSGTDTPPARAHNTASLDFSRSLYLTAHRPLPFALRVEVGLFMHASKCMSCIDLVSALPFRTVFANTLS
jgi:hypothetical protein